MLSSTLLSLAALMVASSTIAAPVSSYARQNTDEESGALTIYCLTARGLLDKRCTPVPGNPVSHIFRRSVARDHSSSSVGGDDESGALQFCPAIGKRVHSKRCPTENIGVHIPNSILGLRTRDTGANDALEPQSSGAFSLEDAAHVASIGSSLVSIGENLFGGKKNRRDWSSDSISASKRAQYGIVTNPERFPSILHLRDEAESGAFGLEDAAHVASIGSSLVSVAENLFGGKKSQRADMLVRDEDSEAISLKTIGTIASFAAPVIGGIVDHFTNKQQRDWLLDELSRRSMGDLDALD